MSGFAIVTSACVNCGRVFGFNPHKVPSVNVNGTREPVCEPCLKVWNTHRVAAGLPAIPALPGAYDPLPAAEL
jgi:hypothetical protein